MKSHTILEVIYSLKVFIARWKGKGDVYTGRFGLSNLAAQFELAAIIYIPDLVTNIENPLLRLGISTRPL
jgi:hypothetical protein